MKKNVLVLLISISLHCVFAIGYGVYNNPYDIYLSGYVVNDLDSHPKKRSYMKNDGGQWEVSEIYHNNYMYNAKGQVVKIEQVQEILGAKTEYYYEYEGDQCTYVKVLHFRKGSNESWKKSEIKIVYSDLKFIETYFSDSNFQQQIEYTLDTKGRIICIKEESYSFFSEKVRLNYIWEIVYEGDSSKIKKIIKTDYSPSGKISDVTNVPYTHTKDTTTIETGDWLKKVLTYEKGLLVSVESYTPRGEQPKRIRSFKYDKNNRLIEDETVSEDKNGNRVGVGTKNVVEY